MNWKQKTIFIFLQIITLGLIWIYWNKKKEQEKDYLSTAKKININIDKLILNVGGIKNIEKIDSTQNKVKFFYKERNDINLEDVKKIKSISGIFINDKSLDIIVGNQAELIKEEIIKKL